MRVRLLGATFAQAPEAASPGKQVVVNWRLGCRFSSGKGPLPLSGGDLELFARSMLGWWGCDARRWRVWE